ncbi:transcription initiation protein SPT3 homolog isoform X2 [Athalia rosae]|nr:transcription initiation protein SPT3 homolog isoform X2 [Athalia rosae]
MMHGFGDCANPLLESAKIIEDVVLQQMRAIVKKACEGATRRGNRMIGQEDFIFLMRKDKVKVQRLLKYLEIKEMKSTMSKTAQPNLDEDVTGFEGSDLVYVKPRRPCHEFIELIDNTGELLENRTSYDIVKQNRLIRAEMITRKMDEIQYAKYCKARHASFTNKQWHKFSDWICPEDDLKITKSGYLILGYLAYETVAQIVDLALLVRHDQNKIHGDAIKRLKFNHCNPYTYKPYQQNMGVVIKAISPSEINEALRRYWSPQLDMTGPFHRTSMRPIHPKLLAC